MANMNITSMVTPRYRQLQAETQDDIAIALSVIEDELNDILAPIEQLRSEVMGERKRSRR